ncbi:probable cytochrome P450 6a14 [Bacillus rossius redtenbacheri]|uniref:probable cytochrome P450 6a14 n=1 Tax=Bacillus rossius redtenbacheri TaxID=93214 RepID=UPI002FDE8711
MLDVLMTTLLAGMMFLLVYWYYSNAFSYWSKRGVHTPKPLPFFGNLKDSMLWRKNFAHAMTDMYLQAEGLPFLGFYRSATPFLMLRDLDLIKHVMVKDFQFFGDRGITVDEKRNPIGAHLFSLGGSPWRKLRVKLTPTFTAGKMRMMSGLVRECCEEMVSWLQDSAAKEEDIEVKEVVAKFTTDVIGSCAFGLQMNSMRDPDSQFRKMGKKMFTPTLRNTLVRAAGSLAPILLKIFPFRLADREVSDFFMKLVGEIVSYREENGITRNDFMQLMIDLKKNNSAAGEDNASNHESSNHVTENNHKLDDSYEITNSRIAAQCLVFFVAGFETSSTALSCCLYELASNPDVQERLAREVASVLGRHGGSITYDALQEMKYMDQVVDETLRRYPPGGTLLRRCTRPYTLPGTSLHLDKGSLVIIPVHGLHHDPEYFPDPLRFDPERFSEENAKRVPQFAYLPFGEGPRICIGLRFGRMQVKACLAALLSRYQFFTCAKTSTPLKFDPRVPLVTTPTEVWLTIKKRPAVKVAGL